MQFPVPSPHDYMAVLSQFPRYSERGFVEHDESGIRGHFASGISGENGMRTNGSYLFTTALLASDPSYDSSTGGLSQDALFGRARSVLGYMTDTHVTGRSSCVDGRRWGNHWQSAWWTTKMAQGAALIWQDLSHEEQQAVERVVVHEAGRQLGRILPTGLFEDTKAEENAWDTEILATAISLFPHHALKEEWRQQLITHSLNTLSVSADLLDRRLSDGRPIRDQVHTVNLYSDFTLDNHGAAHFCYIASPLVSIAWSYYGLKRANVDVPDSLFHHVQDLWQASKPLFLGRRFAHIAGKDWSRYTYGQYFIVPALVMLQQRFSDGDATLIEAARFDTLRAEQSWNDDGSFFGKRVTRNRFFGQSAKYETDCYAKLGLAYCLKKFGNPQPTVSSEADYMASICRTHVSPESFTCLAHTPRVFASYSSRTLTRDVPTLLYVPEGLDDLAEWTAGQWLGDIHIRKHLKAVGVTSMKQLGNGFRVQCDISYRENGVPVFHQLLEITFDADTTHMRIRNRARSLRRVLVMHCHGLNFHAANDWFNGMNRRYSYSHGEFESTYTAQQDELAFSSRLRQKLWQVFGIGLERKHLGSPWLNIDNCLGIINMNDNQGFLVIQRNRRGEEGLNCDLVMTGDSRLHPFMARQGQVLLDIDILLHCGDAGETAALYEASRHKTKTGMS